MNLIKKGTYIDIGEQSSGYLGIIGNLHNTNISELIIHKGSSILIYPPEDYNTVEFCYLVSGKLDAEGQMIEPGDYFFIDYMTESISIDALEESAFLYLSESKIIENIASNMNKLYELISELKDKDPYTREHSHRVSQIAVSLGTHLKLEPKQLDTLNRAAVFHDVGKIKIPAEILNKAGTLTTQEFDTIKKHPFYGYQIALSHSFNDEAEIILQHHENVDGSGYPHGLLSNEISIEAKIIAVSDAYDAMTKDRPYRSALSHEYAVSELRKYTNIRYEKKIVDTLVEIINSGHTF